MANLASVEGSASYSGKAAGLYARQVYEGSALAGRSHGAVHGGRRADGALRWRRRRSEDDRNSIGGTISGFMDGGQSIDSGWSVTLNRIQSGTGGQTWDNNGAFSGGTTAGGGTAGAWSGAFYGDDTAVDGVTPQPSGVAGEFTAGFHNGGVVGAFGTSKQ